MFTAVSQAPLDSTTKRANSIQTKTSDANLNQQTVAFQPQHSPLFSCRAEFQLLRTTTHTSNLSLHLPSTIKPIHYSHLDSQHLFPFRLCPSAAFAPRTHHSPSAMSSPAAAITKPTRPITKFALAASKCPTEAAAYGQCILRDYQSVHQDMCVREFERLKGCFSVCGPLFLAFFVSGARV